jgi:formate hydrogenlyase subunit 3/multisubunit Na+/H+ antiporter MnhD subunit
LGAAFSLTAALGWLRFLPLGPVALPDWGFACLAVGLISMGYGVMQGLQQRNPAALLGWSTVSQMGVVATAIGMAFVAPGAAAALKVAVVIYAAHHALAKTALFLGADVAGAPPPRHSRSPSVIPKNAGIQNWTPACAGVTKDLPQSTPEGAPPPRHSRSPSVIPASAFAFRLRRLKNAGIQNWTPACAGVTKDLPHLERGSLWTMSGLAHTSRALWVVILALPVLVLAGAPLTSGAMSAAVLAHALGLTGMRSVGPLITLVSLALAAHTVLMCRFLHLLVLPDQATSTHHAPGTQPQQAPARATIPWAWIWVVVATAVSLLSPWLVLRLAADPAEAITLSTLWPVVAGVAAGVATIWISSRR